MCVVSMISDHYQDKFRQQTPYIINQQQPLTWTTTSVDFNKVSKEEFDALKKEVEDMKQLLIKAKIYDEKNNEPNCEMENKIELLKKVAEFVGVSLEDVFKK